MRIVLFGTGDDAEQAWLGYNHYWENLSESVVAVLDNDASKWGKFFHGYAIRKPDCLQKLAYDAVVICSSKYQAEIRLQLSEQFSVPVEKILLWQRYLADLNISYQYRRSLSRPVGNGQARGLDLSRIVVYTAIEGDYDELIEPVPESGVDYVCFTDNPALQSHTWQVEHISTPVDGDLARDIRKYKTCPQNYFPEYTLSVWVDASFVLKKSVKDFINKYSRGSGLLCFPHPERFCIYDECGALITIRKAEPVAMIRQVAHYWEEGYPAGNGLYAGGFLVRNHHDEALNCCMEDWWQEIRKFTVRDQLSLPYVLYKHGYWPDLCNLFEYDNEFLSVRKHNMGHWCSAR